MIIGKSRTNQPVEDTDGAVAGLVEEMVESGDLENAKPIYWHGLDIYKSGYSSVQAHVLSNTDTQIGSIELLLNWVKSFGTKIIKLACNGVVLIGASYKAAYFIRFAVTTGVITSIKIYYYDLTNGYTNKDYTEEEFAAQFTNCDDDVNKIN